MAEGVPSIPGSAIVWAGWLHKKRITGFTDSWKRRFCFVSDEYIVYFEPKEKKLQRPHAQNGVCPELEGVSDVISFLEELELKEKGVISMLNIDKCQTSAKNYRFSMILKEVGSGDKGPTREYKFNALTQTDRSSFFQALTKSKQILEAKIQEEKAQGIATQRGVSLEKMDSAMATDEGGETFVAGVVDWAGWLQKSGDSTMGSKFKWRFFALRNNKIEYWCAPSAAAERDWRSKTLTVELLEQENFALKGMIPLSKIGKITAAQRDLTCQIVTGARIYVVKGEDQFAVDQFCDVVNGKISREEEEVPPEEPEEPALDSPVPLKGSAAASTPEGGSASPVLRKSFSLPTTSEVVEEPTPTSPPVEEELGPLPFGKSAITQAIEESPFQCEVHVLEARAVPKNMFLGKADVKIKLKWDETLLTPELKRSMNFFAPADGTSVIEVGETSVIEDTLDPIWEEPSTFTFTVPPSAEHDLLLQVVDMEMHPPDVIGVARLSPAVMREYGKEVELPIQKIYHEGEGAQPHAGEDGTALAPVEEDMSGAIKVYIGLPGVKRDSNIAKSSKGDRIAEVAVLEAVGLPQEVTDPYVKLIWGSNDDDKMEIGHTSVIDTNMPPAWSEDQRFHVILTREHMRGKDLKYLKLEVWDYRGFGFDHIYVGDVTLPSTLVGHLSHTHWLPLSKNGREIENASVSVFIGYIGQVVPEHSRRLKLEYKDQIADGIAHGNSARAAVLATPEAKAAEEEVLKAAEMREAAEAVKQEAKARRKSLKNKKKKKKNAEDIEWCVRIHLMEVADLPDPPLFGARNTFVTFEMNDHTKKSQLRVAMNAPRWAPAESFIFKCNDATKDILEMTVWMYSLTDRTEEQFGFVLLPLVDLRGQGYTKKHLLVKSFENGQLQNTAVVCGIEVMDHEDAMNTKEDRIYEYEAYRPFVGWSHEHLREGSEPRFVLDHEYGDHGLDREERKGKTFEEVDPGIPFNFKVDRDWVTTLIHGGDEEGWDYAYTYDAPEWFHQNSPRLLYRRKTMTRTLTKSIIV